MGFNGYSYNRPDLTGATKNLDNISQDSTKAAGAHIDSPTVGGRLQPNVRTALSKVPEMVVDFPDADSLLSSVMQVQQAMIDGAKAYGAAVGIMSTALGDIVKRYDAASQADQVNADQVKQAMAYAEGVPGATG